MFRVTSNQVRSGLKLALILFQHKDQEVEVETMRQLLEPLTEEQKIGAVKGCQADQYTTEGNSVKGLIVVLWMVLEEEESEDAALTVDEEGPREEEVFFAEMTFAGHL